MTKSRSLSSLAVLAVTGGLCATALAATSYTVKLKLPTSVSPGHKFKVTASGTSASSSRLTVFLSKSCAATAKAEATSAHAIINTNVVHNFTDSKTAKASTKAGSYRACAYLTSGSTTRAKADVKYFITIGRY
jgi:hypothetical protein